jgi:hypothetical protein
MSLSDTGIGGLSLGLSKQKAIRTGLVGSIVAEGTSDLCEPHKGKKGIEYVYFVDDKVSIIAVGPKIRLSTDLGVGDTYADLHAIYPQASGDLGRISVDAPDAAVKAHYRIGINGDQPYPDSVITEIALQSDDQSCYE